MVTPSLKLWLIGVQNKICVNAQMFIVNCKISQRVFKIVLELYANSLKKICKFLYNFFYCNKSCANLYNFVSKLVFYKFNLANFKQICIRLIYKSCINLYQRIFIIQICMQFVYKSCINMYCSKLV